MFIVYKVREQIWSKNLQQRRNIEKLKQVINIITCFHILFIY